MRETIFNVAETVGATITNGQSLSAIANCGGLRLFGLLMPSVWTTANLTFQVSTDGAAWFNAYDANGNEITAAAAAARFIAIDPALFPALQFVRLRSGTAGTPVAQGQDAPIQLLLRQV